MCNDYGNHVAYAEYAEAIRAFGMLIVFPLPAGGLTAEQVR